MNVDFVCFHLPVLLTIYFCELSSGNLHPLALSCGRICPGGSCCEVNYLNTSCCGYENGVCCSDRRSCCPQDSFCLASGSCKTYAGFAPALSLVPPSQSPVERMQANRPHPQICPDRTSTCAQNSTCCMMRNESWGCCPMPDAVCCSDRLHCCPNGTTCDLKSGSCIAQDSKVVLEEAASVESAPEKHLCPDGRHACLNNQTCCPGPNGTWSCCPGSDVVWCEDDGHCCPSGFQYDIRKAVCVKDNTPPAATSCPGGDFRCPSNSTCCTSSDGWACCPFANGVCCPDLMHCCPENTVCDSEKKSCMKSDRTSLSSAVDSTKSPVIVNSCPSGLVSCPNGTCCKNNYGLDACCPHPEAVCCAGGYCCPKGMLCKDNTRTCVAVDDSPWITRQIDSVHPMIPTAENGVSGRTDNLCPDKYSICPDAQSCCLLIDNTYGCCPLPNGSCCADRHHCCPSGTLCTNEGTCLPSRGPSMHKTINAEVMIPNTNPLSRRGPHLPKTDLEGAVVHATFCGSCQFDWLCCPNADGSPNRMCCPEPGSICCPDGKHCCPRQSVCLSNGRCASYAHHEQLSFPVPLSRPRNAISFWRPLPKPTKEWPAAPAKQAHLDVLLLIDSYYNTNSHRRPVCPDRERYCDPGEKCAVSASYGYVCIPGEAASCYPYADKWCPEGTSCYDGITCRSDY